ncbi:MAG: benzoate-CoA ligase family protein [Pyrinomonadaceae bacterium]
MNLFDAIFQSDHSGPALVSDGREMSYAELREQTLEMARALSSLGVAPQDRVVLLLNDSPDFVSAFIAICSMGAIAVPINTALRATDQCTIASNCGAQTALVDGDLCKMLLIDGAESLQQLKKVVIVDTGESTGRTIRGAFNVLILAEVQRDSRSLQTPAFPTPLKDEPAFILYTSGSTGEAKGAVHRQSDIFYTNETYCREVLKVTSDDRLFSSSRLPFAYGLGNSFTFPLLNGATTILCRAKPTALLIAEIFERDKPTIFFGVPVVYNLLLEHHGGSNNLDCSSLRLCVSAGEALPQHLGETWEKTFAIPVLDGIGSTEMLHMFMSNHQKEIRYGSSGKVLENYEARLLDEYGNEAASGVEGNLWIKGESAAIGYWERADETARTFVDGWVLTGDLYRCTDGYWYHMGRSDDCFKSSGQWVSPVEVEGVLVRHLSVARVAVVEGFDDDALACPFAFIVSRDVKLDAPRLESELRELASRSLPRFKQPRRYKFVTELPYTATGKIQRFKLRQQLRDQDPGT